MDQCPVQGESKTLIRLTLQKPEISAGSMGHLARKGFSFSLNKLVNRHPISMAKGYIRGSVWNNNSIPFLRAFVFYVFYSYYFSFQPTPMDKRDSYKSIIFLFQVIDSIEWRLHNVTVEDKLFYHHCCPNEPFSFLKFKLYMKRQQIGRASCRERVQISVVAVSLKKKKEKKTKTKRKKKNKRIQ